MYLDNFSEEVRIKIVKSFEAKFIKRSNECWEWTACKPRGYGFFSWKLNKKSANILAHRLAYELYRGDFDHSLTLDHLCENKGCVNPFHLEPVSSRINTLRCQYAPATINSKKEYCQHGHKFTLENTYIYENNSPRAGQRKCRTCERLMARKRQNWQGGIGNKFKTHCKNGHEFNDTNTYYSKCGRQCRVCRRLKC